jgi:hypothetical protein
MRVHDQGFRIRDSGLGIRDQGLGIRDLRALAIALSAAASDADDGFPRSSSPAEQST